MLQPGSCTIGTPYTAPMKLLVNAGDVLREVTPARPFLMTKN
ncbi:hypothetical protein SSYM_0463 [Serratia symbiotica str. Tucson]|uniref:Uncharacterized protein n=1 Tax=Serratia symbiotica str. Tucson TaxID=914128 RepID=E9CKB5_9GAMM|nr:hypothetical protein SSYM_0463 [Serratia symbiotica str. Tucson]